MCVHDPQHAGSIALVHKAAGEGQAAGQAGAAASPSQAGAAAAAGAAPPAAAASPSQAGDRPSGSAAQYPFMYVHECACAS